MVCVDPADAIKVAADPVADLDRVVAVVALALDRAVVVVVVMVRPTCARALGSLAMQWSHR